MSPARDPEKRHVEYVKIHLGQRPRPLSTHRALFVEQVLELEKLCQTQASADVCCPSADVCCASADVRCASEQVLELEKLCQDLTTTSPPSKGGDFISSFSSKGGDFISSISSPSFENGKRQSTSATQSSQSATHSSQPPTPSQPVFQVLLISLLELLVQMYKY